MIDLAKSLAALVLVAGLGACGNDDTAGSPSERASQSMQDSSTEPTGMIKGAMDAAGDAVNEAVGSDVTGAVQDAASGAMDQARELGDDAVSQARDMAADAVDEAMEDPEAAAKALKDRF